MKKYANYIILPELNLILECCKGQAAVEDAITMKKEEISDNLYKPYYNIIVDFREFDSFIDSTNIGSISDFVNFLKQFGIKSKVALLTTKPHQVIVSKILKDMSAEFLTIEFEIFSTVEAVFKFIDCPIVNYGIINEKITELSHNTG